MPANERIGVPETKARPGEGLACVGGKETATRVAIRPTAAVALPATTLPSQTRDGIPRARAAMTSGMPRYPPLVKTARGRRRPRSVQACGTEAARRSGSSDQVRVRCRRCAASGPSARGRPRAARPARSRSVAPGHGRRRRRPAQARAARRAGPVRRPARGTRARLSRRPTPNTASSNDPVWVVSREIDSRMPTATRLRVSADPP